MKKAEIIKHLQQLKDIKPDSDWLLLSKRALMAKIATLEPKMEKEPVFVFSWQYKLGAVIASLLILISGAVGFAQSASVDSPLYGLKIFSQKAAISLAPKECQLDLRMVLTQRVINDLNNKANTYSHQLALETAIQNLDDLTLQIKNISHPQTVALLTERIQNEATKVKDNLKQIPTNKPETVAKVEKMENQLQAIENRVFTLKTEAEEKIQQCPIYLEKDINYLNEKIDALNLSAEAKMNALNSLKQANELLEANHCVDALVILETLQKELGF